MEYLVRAASEDDWQVLREVRLQALADAPDAFETTLAMALGFTEDRWRGRARGSPIARDFLCFAGSSAVGMAGIYVEEDGAGEIISVWTHPNDRGRGVGRSLVAAAMEFGIGIGVSHLRLWVADGNVAAHQLYERLGFALTGLRQPVPTRPSVEELQMETTAGGTRR